MRFEHLVQLQSFGIEKPCWGVYAPQHDFPIAELLEPDQITNLMTTLPKGEDEKLKIQLSRDSSSLKRKKINLLIQNAFLFPNSLFKIFDRMILNRSQLLFQKRENKLCLFILTSKFLDLKRGRVKYLVNFYSHLKTPF